MAEEAKKPFLDVAARDRERYKKEMAIFKPARDANKPKRPGTAFMLFMGDFRKEMAGKEPEGGVAALAKLGGERWRNMTEDDKRPYVEKQNEEKVRYEASMEDYRKMVLKFIFFSLSPFLHITIYHFPLSHSLILYATLKSRPNSQRWFSLESNILCGWTFD